MDSVSLETLIAKTSIETPVVRDRGSVTDAIAACETAWIPYLFALPHQIFLLPGRPSRRETFVWNLWAIAQPWPESLAQRWLTHRNGWANLRPIWTAHIDKTSRRWRMTTWSWAKAKEPSGHLELSLEWVIAGNMHRVYAAYPPPLNPSEWLWDPGREEWTANHATVTWHDPALLEDFATWLVDPHSSPVDDILAHVFADVTVPAHSRWNALGRWWRRS